MLADERGRIGLESAIVATVLQCLRDPRRPSDRSNVDADEYRQQLRFELVAARVTGGGFCLTVVVDVSGAILTAQRPTRREDAAQPPRSRRRFFLLAEGGQFTSSSLQFTDVTSAVEAMVQTHLWWREELIVENEIYDFHANSRHLFVTVLKEGERGVVVEDERKQPPMTFGVRALRGANSFLDRFTALVDETHDGTRKRQSRGWDGYDEHLLSAEGSEDPCPRDFAARWHGGNMVSARRAAVDENFELHTSPTECLRLNKAGRLCYYLDSYCPRGSLCFMRPVGAKREPRWIAVSVGARAVAGIIAYAGADGGAPEEQEIVTWELEPFADSPRSIAADGYIGLNVRRLVPAVPRDGVIRRPSWCRVFCGSQNVMVLDAEKHVFGTGGIAAAFARRSNERSDPADAEAAQEGASPSSADAEDGCQTAEAASPEGGGQRLRQMAFGHAAASPSPAARVVAEHVSLGGAFHDMGVALVGDVVGGEENGAADTAAARRLAPPRWHVWPSTWAESLSTLLVTDDTSLDVQCGWRSLLVLTDHDRWWTPSAARNARVNGKHFRTSAGRSVSQLLPDLALDTIVEFLGLGRAALDFSSTCRRLRRHVSEHNVWRPVVAHVAPLTLRDVAKGSGDAAVGRPGSVCDEPTVGRAVGWLAIVARARRHGKTDAIVGRPKTSRGDAGGVAVVPSWIAVRTTPHTGGSGDCTSAAAPTTSFFGALTRALSNFVGPRRRLPRRTLFVGLDAAGKTTILYKLRQGDIATTIPTIGFNVESLVVKAGSVSATGESQSGTTELDVVSWDIGGPDKIRPLWRHYLNDLGGLVFVIDSNDSERFSQFLHEIRFFFDESASRACPVLLFANKQDLPGSWPAQRLVNVLQLESRCEGRHWRMQPSVATTGEGLVAGLTWLAWAMAQSPPV